MKLITLMLFCLICSFVHSEDSPIAAVKATLASKSLLLDITIVDQKQLVAVGERGHILTSFDGISWQQMNVPVQTTLTKVFFINSLLGWAVGHDATILHTDDGGQNWNIQQYLPTTEKPLFDITFINKKHHFFESVFSNPMLKAAGKNAHVPLLVLQDLRN